MSVKRFFAWVMIWVLSPFAVLGTALGRARPAVILTVSVFNDARLPPLVMEEAKQRAEEVFERAGVSLNWLDCGSPGRRRPDRGCLALSFPEHLSVRLIEGLQERNGEVYGQSYLDARGQGNYANVYISALASSKALSLVKEGDLLGYIVVHELGHLLLGGNSHSPEGLMRAKWQVAELHEAASGTLGFSAEQAQRMRARYLGAKGADLKSTAMGK